MALIKSLCSTILEVPFKKLEYVRMIQDVLDRYFERCQQQFRFCTTHGSEESPISSISRMWLDEQELLDIVTRSKYFQLSEQPKDGTGGDASYQGYMDDGGEFLVQEIIMQSRLTFDRSFQRMDLIFDSKKLERLAFMRVTLVRWNRIQMHLSVCVCV